MSAFTDWWDRRGATERRTLKVALAAVIAVAAAAAWYDLQRTRSRLEARLPELRASVAALERDAAEVKRLRAIAPAAASQASGGAPLASLATNSGGLAGAQVGVVDDKHVRVSGADVAFGALLEFLRNAQVTHGMRVDTAHIEALAAPGRVRVEITLARS